MQEPVIFKDSNFAQSPTSASPQLELSDQDLDFEELLSEELPLNEIDERIALLQESELIHDAFTNGVDLRAYTEEAQKELLEAEEALINDFNDQLPAILELSKQVEQCDGVLAAMEQVLGGFRGRLRELNQDISEIQAQSREMQIKLAKRLEVHRLLTRTIDQLAISPENIRIILEGHIGTDYVASLLALQKNFMFMQLEAGRKLPAFKQMAPEHDKLRFKAAKTIRQFFLSQLESLGSLAGELADLHRLQRDILLPFKSLYHVMVSRHPGVAAEIAQYYVNYSIVYHLQTFDHYLKSLFRRQLVVGDKLDLLGNDSSQKKALLDFSVFGGAVSLKDKHNLLSLGERGLVLEFPEDYVPIGLHGVTKHRFEELFKSFNFALSVSLAQEHLFLQQFFVIKQKEFPAELLPEQMFKDIFARVFKRVHNTLQQQIDGSYDAIGILLCIRLNGQFSAELRDQLGITSLDGDYFHTTDRIFWPRFQAVLNSHIHSLKKSSLVSSFNPKDILPHYLSRRYAEMAASMLTLAQGHDEPMLFTSLSRLRVEFLAALEKMKSKIHLYKLSLIFLLNNYDLIMGVLGEHPPRAIEAELAQFKTLHSITLDEYIQEELVPLFGDITKLVEDPNTDLSANHCSQLVSHFNQGYRPKLAKLNSTIMGNFPNLQHATAILHRILAHTMLVYSKFLSSIDANFTGANPLSVVPVSLHQLKAEIKKYRSNF
ncbi:Vacuolar protein sorting-associated protein 52 [Entomophthora muscae]|uniref:Vacuolar protein sorting-associated protein 52 n=1 Tax=Entomophthora muscae TaxID=34485 RepID=A0ACC2UHZ0_9FUNG|nr:Vacuolar protein sorting-associated protein 52 [Entomophthora muscae]